MSENNEQPNGQAVPWERFTQVNDRMKAAEAKVAELTQVASSVSAYQSELSDLRGQLAQTQQQMSTTNTLLGAGIYDGEQRELAQYCYSKLPEEGRPALNDFLSQQREAPSGLMRHVWGQRPAATTQTPAAPISEPQAAPQTAAPISEPQPAAPQPAAPQTAAPHDPNAGAVNHQRPPAQAMGQDYIRSLTTEQYRAQRDKILATLGKQ